MPTRTNPDGSIERISTAQAAEECRSHMEKLNAAGVTWEDLSDRREVERKLAEYEKNRPRT